VYPVATTNTAQTFSAVQTVSNRLVAPGMQPASDGANVLALTNAAGTVNLLQATTTAGSETLNVTGGFRVNSVPLLPGRTWTARNNVVDNQLIDIAGDTGPRLVAVCFDGDDRVLTSDDGVTWVNRASADDGSTWYRVIYAGGQYVAIASTGTERVMTSPDGLTWTAQTAAEANEWRGLTYDGVNYIASAASGTNRVMTSPDAITWTARSITSGAWFAAASTYDLAIVGTTTGDVCLSTDHGATWGTPITVAAINTRKIIRGPGQFVLLASSSPNRCYTSPDGTTWTARTIPLREWYDVCYAYGQYYAVSDDGFVATSPDAITWTEQTAAAANQWRGITAWNGLIVASAISGTGNRIMTSGVPALL
jgi:hypothetical protein